MADSAAFLKYEPKYGHSGMLESQSLNMLTETELSAWRNAHQDRAFETSLVLCIWGASKLAEFGDMARQVHVHKLCEHRIAPVRSQATQSLGFVTCHTSSFDDIAF